MRIGVVVVGVALLAAGVTAWAVNVPGPSSHGTLTTSVTTVQTEIVGSSLPLALLTARVPYTLTWTTPGSSTTDMRVFACGTDSQCRSFNSSAPVAQGTGANGTLAWSGAKGAFFQIVPAGIVPGQNVSISVSFLAPLWGGLAGFAAVLIGAPVAIAGGWLPPRRPTPE